MALSLKTAKYLLLCDFDGTVFDGMNPKADALVSTFNTHRSSFFLNVTRVGSPARLMPFKPSEIRTGFFEHAGKQTEEVIQSVFLDVFKSKPAGNLLDAMVKTQLENEKNFVEKDGKFFEDTRKLKELEDHGIAVGVTTGGEHSLVQSLVKKENHEDVFSFVGGRAFGHEENSGVEFRKGVPHLDFINRWRRNLGPIPVYYYGDTVKDLEVGVALGARKIFMREGTMSRGQILAAAERMGLQKHVIVVKHSGQVVEHMKNFVRE